MAASTKAEGEKEKGALELLLEAAPTNDDFTIEIRPGIGFRFRMLHTHSEFARWNSDATIKAEKIARTLFKLRPDAEIQPADLLTVVQCCKIADLALDDSASVSRLFELSQKWGVMFEGLWNRVSEKLVAGEVQAINKAVEEAKND